MFEKSRIRAVFEERFLPGFILYHERQVTKIAQSVMNINSMKPGLPVFRG
jgi:hypothetical protein